MENRTSDSAIQKSIELFIASIICSYYSSSIADFFGQPWIKLVMVFLAFSFIYQGLKALVKGNIIQFSDRGIEIHCPSENITGTNN